MSFLLKNLRCYKIARVKMQYLTFSDIFYFFIKENKHFLTFLIILNFFDKRKPSGTEKEGIPDGQTTWRKTNLNNVHKHLPREQYLNNTPKT